MSGRQRHDFKSYCLWNARHALVEEFQRDKKHLKVEVTKSNQKLSTAKGQVARLRAELKFSLKRLEAKKAQENLQHF